MKVREKGAAHVRTVVVAEKEYLQVVRYARAGLKTKIDVLKSFGERADESFFRAEQWAANFNILRDIARNVAKNKEVSMVVFGQILGIDGVKEALKI